MESDGLIMASITATTIIIIIKRKANLSKLMS